MEFIGSYSVHLHFISTEKLYVYFSSKMLDTLRFSLEKRATKLNPVFLLTQFLFVPFSSSFIHGMLFIFKLELDEKSQVIDKLRNVQV